METILTLLLAAAAVVAGVLLGAVGIFSVLALLWDDLLETDTALPAEPPISDAA